MIKDLEELQKKAEEELSRAGTEEELLVIKTKYLGRKGLLTGLLRNITSLPTEERALFGKRSNEVKDILTAKIEDILQDIASRKRDETLLRERIDVTLPGRGIRYGRIHPVTQVSREICDIFAGLGFSIVEGPEVELHLAAQRALGDLAMHRCVAGHERGQECQAEPGQERCTQGR